MIAAGTPEEVAAVEESYTGQFLRRVLAGASRAAALREPAERPHGLLGRGLCCSYSPSGGGLLRPPHRSARRQAARSRARRRPGRALHDGQVVPTAQTHGAASDARLVARPARPAAPRPSSRAARRRRRRGALGADPRDRDPGRDRRHPLDAGRGGRCSTSGSTRLARRRRDVHRRAVLRRGRLLPARLSSVSASRALGSEGSSGRRGTSLAFAAVPVALSLVRLAASKLALTAATGSGRGAPTREPGGSSFAVIGLAFVAWSLGAARRRPANDLRLPWRGVAGALALAAGSSLASLVAASSALERGVGAPVAASSASKRASSSSGIA